MKLTHGSLANRGYRASRSAKGATLAGSTPDLSIYFSIRLTNLAIQFQDQNKKNATMQRRQTSPENRGHC
ncbi:uncharacterized protein TrAFT101_004088 [Trichoderma asperellum]|uniref:uncharacterized protein n=1 Tax=Trichoderma asperellum TaxID=101201 RepID=UPI003332C05C|nr:hypothetical protein TrAFT101_004088 [Trichoderma asperellum]